MSPSARRLSSAVATNRFAWQGGDPPSAPAVMPVLRSVPSTAPSPPVPAMRDLPSPAAERLELIEREAYARGQADGERAAAAAAAERIEATSARLAVSVQELAGVRTVLMRRAERDLVRLAISMAERILRREVDTDRDLLAVMARVAIDRLGENTVATIHLNPADHEALAARQTLETGKTVELVPDASVPRAGCIIRSAFGTIDMGIDSQMRELSRALLGEESDHGQEGTDGAVAGA